MASTHRLSIGNVESFNKVNGNLNVGTGISKAGSRRLSVVSRKSSISNSTLGDAGHSRWRRPSRQMSISLNPRFSNPQLSSAAESRRTKSVIKLENTFKMEPDEGTKFRPESTEKIIKQTLEQHLAGMRYEPKTCSIFAQRIAEEIKCKVKDLHFPRYKLVAQVLVNSKNQQSCQVASRAVWNTETDNFAACTYQNDSLIALGMVHASYYE
ncbi:tctex1 domain-containing protein 1-B-like [Anneissia japonica]|uniref:tctex1 domain-containing protein 1-B-like n=1 Tax=Anneissia japonica TaxID=1529436 RepID=UPI0014255096|nr:tctex1 domain-containing protein 1-B-like [Anneissia japonica]